MLVAISDLSMWCQDASINRTSVEELLSAFYDTLSHLGVSDIAYLQLSTIAPPVVHTTYSNAWCEYYAENRLVLTDPTIANAMCRVMPVRWDIEKTSGKDRQFHELAVYYGVPPRGLTFALRDPIGGVPIFTLSSKEQSAEWDQILRQYGIVFQNLGMVFHDTVMRLSPRPMPKLSPREKDVLDWAAQGKTAWETGQILGLTEGTTNQYLRVACRKLRAVSKIQAVVAAKELGLLSPSGPGLCTLGTIPEIW